MHIFQAQLNNMRMLSLSITEMSTSSTVLDHYKQFHTCLTSGEIIMPN